MDLNQFFDYIFKGFGAILVVVMVALLLKDASKFNTLATSSSQFVTALGNLG